MVATRKKMNTHSVLGIFLLPGLCLLFFVKLPKSTALGGETSPWVRLHDDEARSLSLQLEQELQRRVQEARTFAANTVLTTNNPPRITSILNEYHRLYSQLELVAFIDPQGSLLGVNDFDRKGRATIKPAVQNFGWRDQTWFQIMVKQAQEKSPSADLLDTSVGPDPLLLSAYGEQKNTLVLNLPAWNRLHQFMGVLSVRGNLQWLQDVVKVYESRYVYQTMDSYLLRIVQKNPSFEILSRSKGQGAGEITFQKILSTDVLKSKAPWELSSSISVKSLAANRDPIPQTSMETPKSEPSIATASATLSLRAQKAPTSSEAPSKTIARDEQSWWPFAMATLVLSTAIVLYFLRKKKQLQSKFSDSVTQYKTIIRKRNQSLQEQTTSLSTIMNMVGRWNQILREKSHPLQLWRDEATRNDEMVQGMQRRCQAEEVNLSELKKLNLLLDQFYATEQNSSQRVAPTNPSNDDELRIVSDLIGQIEQKTKVIHEIVFQTKLLSFNASVEAARAGDYGRGFSIVAEEIGNLALMSGQAAKDIASLLQESSTKVKDSSKNRTRAAKDLASKDLPSFPKEQMGKALQQIETIAKAFSEQQQNLEQLSSFHHKSLEQTRMVHEFFVDFQQQNQQLEKLVLQHLAVAKRPTLTLDHSSLKKSRTHKDISKVEVSRGELKSSHPAKNAQRKAG